VVSLCHFERCDVGTGDFEICSRKKFWKGWRGNRRGSSGVVGSELLLLAAAREEVESIYCMIVKEKRS
jgi:hypothetical protein